MWVTSAAVGVAAGGALLVGVVGGALWDRATAQQVVALASGENQDQTAVYAEAMLEGLPEPVQRYFRFTLRPGQPLIRSARIEHEGTFLARPDGAWSPFRSVQHFSTDPPGFVWDARIRMAPGVTARIRDSYFLGDGVMEGRLNGVLKVVDERHSPTIDSGALHRFLAEAAWFPTALLPRPGLRWEAIDDNAARVTLEDRTTTVSLDVHFSPAGELMRVEGERLRDVAGVGVPTLWVGTMRDYREIDGMMIPASGDVTWILPEGPYTYWRGTARKITYTFAEGVDLPPIATR